MSEPSMQANSELIEDIATRARMYFSKEEDEGYVLALLSIRITDAAKGNILIEAATDGFTRFGYEIAGKLWRECANYCNEIARTCEEYTP